MSTANRPPARQVYGVTGTCIPRMQVSGVNWLDALGQVAALVESVLPRRELVFHRLDEDRVQVDDKSTGNHFLLCRIDGAALGRSRG